MKTRKLRKSMMSAVVILMAAVLSLTGATYAWFTTGTSASVEQISAGVEEGTGLLISVDGSTWVSKVEFQKGEGFQLQAVSTDGVVGKTTEGLLDFHRATLNTTSSPSKIAYSGVKSWDKKAAAADNDNEVVGRDGFIAFDIYFNNMEQGAKKIGLKNGITSTAGHNQALRVAFIVQGTLSAGYGTDGFADDLGDVAWDGSSEGGKITIFEPYANSHLTTALAEYQQYVKDTADATSKFDYLGIAGSFEGNIDRYTEVEDVLVPVTTIGLANGQLPQTELFTIPENTCLKLTVVVWLEGQDADCLNANSGGTMNFDLGFEIVP